MLLKKVGDALRIRHLEAHSLSVSIHFPLSSLFVPWRASLLTMYTTKNVLAMANSRPAGREKQGLAILANKYSTNTQHLNTRQNSTPARMPSYLQIKNVASCRLCIHLPSQFFCFFLSTSHFCNISILSRSAEYHQEAEMLKKSKWTKVPNLYHLLVLKQLSKSRTFT